MHVIERTDKFTLVGTDARRGKLTLFAEEGPRERGALKHVALRVSNLGRGARPARGRRRRARGRRRLLRRGRRLAARARRGRDRRRVRPRPRRALLGVARGDGEDSTSSSASLPEDETRVEVGGAFVEFHQGEPGDPEKPLLNHLAVLVDSAEETLEEAKQAGMEVADVVDAPNTLAVFVWGPEHVKIEYVEQKPTFALK